jgi:pimeloyl-ACP methyl ester carboxylesterase
MNRCMLVVAALWLATPVAGRAQDRYFDSHGVRIRYVDQGAGEPIVLLHGVGGSVDTWTSTGILQDLAKDHRVIALDLRGHGKSGKPHDPRMYGREMGLDVVRLLDHLGISRAHVAGYSLGGMLLAQLITLVPERFATATLIAGPGLYGSPSASANGWEQRAREFETECVSRSLIVALAPTDGPAPSEARIKELSTECFADSTRDRFAIAALMRSRGDNDVAPAAAARVTVPTLGIVGTADPMKQGMDSLVAIRPGVRLILLDGATHAGPRGILTRKELVPALREFVGAHPVR